MDWTNLITNLGFPIAMCVYFVVNEAKSRKGLVRRIETLENQQEVHAERLYGVIDKNTIAMINLQNTLKSRPCLHQETDPLGKNSA